MASKFALLMNTSPRTVMVKGSFSVCGMVFMVFRLVVTSSPINPFPRVAPCTNTPFSYFNAADKPSILVSTTYFVGLSFSFAIF